MDEKIKARMLKILALAKDGVGGEKENAERMLEALCKKHGVTIDQLEGTGKVERRWFYVNTKYEKRLLFQVLYLLVDKTERTATWWKHPKRSRAIGLDLTDGEFAQVTVGFETYKAAWTENLDAFFLAFVWKNRIYGLKDRNEEYQPTPEEEERARRAAEMMHGINRVELHKRLPNK